jgi:tetratricopeptide (TPR) repeat protein
MSESADAEQSAIYANIDRAYALDREGREHEAIHYYDRAWHAGVPADRKQRFIVGYGSTLRNVGRADEAVGLLAQAVADHPDYAPYSAFLALALLSSGNASAALATMLGVALDHARPSLDGYDRALTDYHKELLEKAQLHS